MAFFRVPYSMPPPNFGYAPVDYGQQAGSMHSTEQVTRPMIQPRATNTRLMGMGVLPYFAMGQTPIIAPNNYLGNPQALEITGIYKSSVGG